MNLNRLNMLLWSELFSDLHCSSCAQEPTTRVHLCARVQTLQMEMGHTHVQGCSQLHTGSLQTAPAGQWQHVPTLASQCSFSLIPRGLLFPLICLLSILERKDYTAQHTPGTWSHSRLWVLIPPPLVSPPGACGCGGVCTDMHISFPWLPSLTCSGQDGIRIQAQTGSIAQLLTPAPSLFSRNYILHFYFKHISCQSSSPKTLISRCSHSPHCGRAFPTGICLLKHREGEIIFLNLSFFSLPTSSR